MELNKRDYIKDPLKRNEIPSYEDLFYYFITENLPIWKLKSVFGKSSGTIQKWIKFYELQKTQEQVKECIEKTNIEKYGVKKPSQNPQIKEKYKNTCLKKYGVKSTNQLAEVQEKKEKTCLKKYGSKCSLRNETVLNKAKQTSKEKYGEEFFVRTKEFKQKTKESFQKHYGTTNISNSHLDFETVKILDNKKLLCEYITNSGFTTLQDLAKRLNVSYSGLQKRLHKHNLWDLLDHKQTQAELDLKKLFPEFCKTRKIIYPYEIDLYNEDLKLGIEFNGNYWHSTKFKDKNYHFLKTKLCLEKRIRLFNIFEFEWKSPQTKKIIISHLRRLTNKLPILNTENYEIKQISFEQCLNFCQANTYDFLQPGPDGTNFGLFLNNQLVCSMSFLKNELISFAKLLDFEVENGYKVLFNYFCENYNSKEITCSLPFGKCFDLSHLGFTYTLKEANFLCNVTDKGQIDFSREDDCSYKLYDCGVVLWVSNQSSS